MSEIFNPPKCQKVLPLSYDNSLSYYEVVCKLTNFIEEMNTRLDNYGEQVLNEANAYTDSQIADSIAQYSAALEAFKAEYALFVTNVDNTLTGFQNQMTANFSKQDAEIAGTRAYTDVKIEQNNAWLLEQISDTLISVRVLNPFTGERTSIQDMIDYLSSLHMTEAAKISEIVAFSRTVTKVVSYNATCTQLVNNGRAIFEQS